MALADGELQTEERELMQVLADRFALSEEDLAEAIGDARRGDVDALKTKLDHEDQKTVLQYAVMAAFADGHMDDKERRFLEHLEERFELTKKEIRALEGLGRDLAKAARRRPIDLERLNDIVESFLD
jgi:tellurite resistance protein